MKEIEIFLRHFLLSILLLFKSGRRSTDNVDFNEDSKILFIRLNRIGDALVTTPLLKVVKETLHCRIEVLADAKNNFVYQHNPHVSKVHIFKKGFSGFREVVKLIRSKDYNAIVDMHDDVSTTVTFILAFSNCRNIFGLSKGNDQVYTKTVPRLNPQTTHVIDRLLPISSLFNINTIPDTNIVYCINENTRDLILQTIRNRFPDKKFLIGINISAGSPARYWGTERFKQLHQYLSNYDVTPLFLCSPGDIQLAMEITGKKENIFYSPSFEEFSAMVAQTDMLFTPDTSVIHIASAFRIPVFGLYVKYNTSDMIWSPYKSDFDYVVTEEPTLINVSYDEVISKFSPFFKKYITK